MKLLSRLTVPVHPWARISDSVVLFGQQLISAHARDELPTVTRIPRLGFSDGPLSVKGRAANNTKVSSTIGRVTEANRKNERLRANRKSSLLAAAQQRSLRTAVPLRANGATFQGVRRPNREFAGLDWRCER